jgi:hypothetical protein
MDTLREQVRTIQQKLEKNQGEDLESQFRHAFAHLHPSEGETEYEYQPPQHYPNFSSAEIAKYIDHTILKPDAKHEDIVKLCEEAKKFGFKAVCVNGARAELAKSLLSTSPLPQVSVAAVVGFPLGASTS